MRLNYGRQIPMNYEERSILQAKLRDAHMESLRLDVANRAINRISYVNDSQRGWSEAWQLWTAYESGKK